MQRGAGYNGEAIAPPRPHCKRRDAEGQDMTDMHLTAVMIGVILVGPILMWALVQIANKR